MKSTIPLCTSFYGDLWLQLLIWSTRIIVVTYDYYTAPQLWPNFGKQTNTLCINLSFINSWCNHFVVIVWLLFPAMIHVWYFDILLLMIIVVWTFAYTTCNFFTNRLMLWLWPNNQRPRLWWLLMWCQIFQITLCCPLWWLSCAFFSLFVPSSVLFQLFSCPSRYVRCICCNVLHNICMHKVLYHCFKGFRSL